MEASLLGRVLVVEPDGEREANELGRRGFEVQRVAKGSASVALAGKEPFDVVLFDASMPEMDGLSLVTQLREHAPSTRVVIFMAKHTNELAAQAAEVGVFQMLQKPADMNSLIRVVRAAVMDRRHSMLARPTPEAAPQPLTREFDELVSCMRTPAARAAARELFTATPHELGGAALVGAKQRGD